MLNPKRVRVYRNLHNGKLSLRVGKLVVGHCDYVELINPKFIVLAAGKLRAVETKVRNVHAFVEGEVIDMTGFVPYKGRTLNFTEQKYDISKTKGYGTICYKPFELEGFYHQGREYDLSAFNVVTIDTIFGIMGKYIQFDEE